MPGVIYVITPSKNPYKGSKIKMSIFGTSDEPVVGQYSPKSVPLARQYHPISGQAVDRHSPTSGQALVSTINNNKQVNNIKQPKGRQAVIDFFLEKNFTADEGKKFFEHYETRNWKTSDGKAIRDWQALAIHWMDRAELFRKENNTNTNSQSQFRDNLRTSKHKDYGQPL